ncbi:MAG: glycosyltransferase family 39 protein [Elusimicrobia bacterium]|nr:glycosyltransferase family 39 protein [Elusimicrobiota bacterium]
MGRRRHGARKAPAPEAAPPPAVEPSGRRLRPEWVLFAAALAVRFVHLWWHHGDFWLTTPLLDDNIFSSWADVIAREGWRAPSLGAFDFNPAYPYFLAAFRALLGGSQLVLFAFQHLAGALLAPLVYRVAARSWDRRAGWAAGLLAACYGPAVFFESRLLGECWILLANAAALWLLLRAGQERRSWPWWGAAGLALGVSAVLRPTALAFAPFCLAWAAWSLSARPRRFAAALPAFLVGVWLPLFPFQLRNRLVVPGAGWGLTTSSGGVNLYLGNNPEADGLNNPPSFVRYGPGHEYKDFSEEAERRLRRPLTRAEVSRYWTGQTLLFWEKSPERALDLLARKAGYFWNWKEPPDNFFLAIFRRFNAVGGLPLVPWGLVAPLGLAGLAWSLRRPGETWLLHAYVLTYFALCLAFYVLARYRFPAAAALLCFAGFALARLWDYAEARRWGKAGALGGLCLLTFGLSRIPLIGDEDPGSSHYSMAVVYANQGWKDKALEEYEASVEADPAFKASWLNMGILLAGEGRGKEASAALARAAALETDPARKALIQENARRLGGAP